MSSARRRLGSGTFRLGKGGKGGGGAGWRRCVRSLYGYIHVTLGSVVLPDQLEEIEP